jgi:hypothetical protein
MISGFANAINGSINQQKFTRSYFYFKLQNNSTIPKPTGESIENNWSNFGMFFIGWRDRSDNEKPVAACYQLTIPLSANQDDKCEQKYSNPSTMFIRVETVYGVCGGSYEKLGSNDFALLPDYFNRQFQLTTSESSCLLIQ